MKKGCFITVILIIIIAGVIILFGRDIVDAAMKIIYPREYSEIVQRESEYYGIDENFVYALIKAESKFDKNAVSSANAKGLMQLTDATFEWMNSLDGGISDNPNIFSPDDNIHAGCAFLKILISDFGDYETVLAAYNGGMGNVAQWLEDEKYSADGKTLHTIPFPETKKYTKRVLDNYNVYSNLYK